MASKRGVRRKNERKKESTCGKKIKYPSVEAATPRLNQLRKVDINVGVYSCPYCKNFHIGRNKFALKIGMRKRKQW